MPRVGSDLSVTDGCKASILGFIDCFAYVCAYSVNGWATERETGAFIACEVRTQQSCHHDLGSSVLGNIVEKGLSSNLVL